MLSNVQYNIPYNNANHHKQPKRNNITSDVLHKKGQGHKSNVFSSHIVVMGRFPFRTICKILQFFP